jgi:hypothetical protein
MSRFMLFVMQDADAAAGQSGPPPVEMVELVEKMNAFNEEMLRAGVLLAADGLMPASAGARVRFEGGERPSVVDGPFAEAKEVVGGYWIIQARTQEEAVEWASRAPLPSGTIEIRKIGDPEDYSAEVADAARMTRTPPEQTLER